MTKTMKAYYAKAYPKINITLKIGEKIGNLHTLQSRFCLVEGSLYDSFLIIKEPLDNEVLTQKDLVKKLPQRYTTFSETTKQHNAIQCCLYGNFDCKLEDNLIYKAYMLLAKHIDSNINPCSIHIIVDKRIPVGGGLGGGSVNAALMLLLLNELFNLNCSKEILYQYAKALGSDVAFFLMIYTQNSTHITPYFYVEQNLSKGDLDSILFKQTQDENLDSNKEARKDISCLRTRTSEDLAHTCKYDRNLDSIFLDSLKQKRQDHSINFLSANVYGTGEIIEPFYEKLPHFLIHCNTIACNTGAVYKEFAREKHAIKDSKKENIDLQQDSITLLQAHDIYTLNDLYKPACNLYELEAIAKGLHKKYGNVYFSGSGSSFFSINHDIKE
ncbi:4-(cytidine 5'-diphospho)-2-C-methyl-D-erythritol kinase [Helicobacter bilis]|uniref:GHMP family kinase ATP-binding protein n=1 Tax=Helicobacter bilis TaxID=37372 RepID=UPI00248E19E2|nr:4-(cytidine 5'-diphospho)-2-C-methyl-D-erythritol kinase [Helicobacter bilis]